MRSSARSRPAVALRLQPVKQITSFRRSCKILFPNFPSISARRAHNKSIRPAGAIHTQPKASEAAPWEPSPINASAPKGQLIKPQFRMICAFSAQCCVVNASPNVPFAALALRWAIDGLGFQPVFCGANQTNPNESKQIPCPATTNTSRPREKTG